VELTVADAAFLRGTTPSFVARATIVLDPAGRVASLRSEASAAARGDRRALTAETRFALAATAVARRAAPPLPDVDGPTRTPGQIVSALSDADVERQFAGDLTVDDVAATVDDYDRGVEPDPAWIGHAASFVRLHPEVVPALTRRFPGVGPAAKELVFDIL